MFVCLLLQMKSTAVDGADKVDEVDRADEVDHANEVDRADTLSKLIVFNTIDTLGRAKYWRGI